MSFCSYPFRTPECLSTTFRADIRPQNITVQHMQAISVIENIAYAKDCMYLGSGSDLRDISVEGIADRCKMGRSALAKNCCNDRTDFWVTLDPVFGCHHELLKAFKCRNGSHTVCEKDTFLSKMFLSMFYQTWRIKNRTPPRCHFLFFLKHMYIIVDLCFHSHHV